MNVLIVEDEARIADFIARGLRAELHNPTVVSDGESALKMGSLADFDAIILDLLLPKVHGHEVCQVLRQRGVKTPIIMLSALGETGDRIQGLRLGADDYMVKPFAFDELLVRLEALVRRTTPDRVLQPKLVLADLVFDRETMEVAHSGNIMKLTAKELAVLELLMSGPGKVFSRERILCNVWDAYEDPLTNVVDVYIGRLRKHLRASGGSVGIQTMRGLGYRLVTERADHGDDN